MTLRRLLVGALSVAALTAAPITAVSSAQPGPLGSCPPGETAAATTCSPFCLPGLVWDNLNTGLCLPAAPPPAPYK
jgi:hypothetical protein